MQQKIAKHQSEINELKNQNTELEVSMQGIYDIRVFGSACFFLFLDGSESKLVES